MAALLHHPPGVHDHDRVRVANGGQPVGYDEARPAPSQPGHRFLDQDLGPRIDVARGLVQDQDAGVGQEGPGDGDQLLLAGRDVGGVLVEHGFVAVREGADELVHVSRGGSRHDLLAAGPGPPVADVVRDRAREQPGVLKHHAEDPAHLVPRQVPGVDVLDPDRPRIDLVEAHQEVDDGGLARPGGTHDGDSLPRRDLQAEVLDQRFLRLVAEGHPFQADPAGDRGKRERVGPIEVLLGGVKELEDPF